MSTTNSVSYTGDGVTGTFTIPFDFLRPSDLTLYVAGVSAPFTVSGTTMTPTTVPANGASVVISRVTAVDERVTEFFDDGAITAENLNDQFDQVLFAVQDAQFRIDGIVAPSGGGGGGGATVPTPSAADRMLLTQADGMGGFEYSFRTIAQMQTVLGITSPITIPSPVLGNRFLVTNASTNTYELQTLAQVRTLIGVPTFNLPPLNGGVNRFLISDPTGTTVGWYVATYARSLLGLGTASLANTGTAVGNLPALVSGSSGAALPAISGEYLTNVARALDFALWAKNTSVAVASASGFVNLTSSAFESVAPAAAWARSCPTGVQLDTGTYLVRYEAYCDPASTATSITYRIAHSLGTATPSSGSIANLGTEKGHISVECVFRVTSATADFALEADAGGGGGAGSASVTNVRMNILKIA